MKPAAPLIARGTWPDRVVLLSGWAKAHARPFNDDVSYAVLRLERGGAKFLRRCTDWLFGQGAPAVISGPLQPGSMGVWTAAGFESHRELTLLERDLSEPIPEPPLEVRPGRSSEWASAAQIDRLAFDLDWRLGRLGLSDAAAATPRSRFLVTGELDHILGFAVVGAAQHTSYLQRLAVHPAASGRGAGRALLRASLTWARTRGARSMLLNTQPENLAAIGLYRSERFRVLPYSLGMLRATPPETS